MNIGKNACLRIEILSSSYNSIFRRHELAWIKTDTEKVAVCYDYPAMVPESLRARLEAILELSYYEIRKDLTGFMKHEIKLAEAFQMVDNWLSKKSDMDWFPLKLLE